jgi:hypothetical protein
MTLQALEHAEAELERLSNLPGYFKYSMAGNDGVHNITDSFVCYSIIGNIYPKGKNSIFIDSSVYPFYTNYKRDEKKFKDYIKWLVRKSMFAPAFISKDPEKIWKRGALFNAEKYAAYYIIAAATALRYVSENPEIIDVWYRLRDYCSYNQAWLLAHHFRLHIEGLARGTSSRNTNHIVPPPRCINIKGKKINRYIGGPMAGNANYRGLARTWDKENHLTNFQTIHNFPPTSSAGKVNSFGKPITTDYYKLDDLKHVVKETLKLNNEPVKKETPFE